MNSAVISVNHLSNNLLKKQFELIFFNLPSKMNNIFT